MSTFKHTVVYNIETGQLVAPIGKHFKNAAQYDPAVDKGKIVCVHCREAFMAHRNRKEAIGGGNVFGWRAHFTTIGTREPKHPKTDSDGQVIPYKKNAHSADCVAAVLAPEEGDDPDKTNHDKGFKIYVDMGYIKRKFRKNASPLIRDEDTHRIVNMNPDLIDRERLTLQDPGALISAIKHVDAARLKDSVAVFEEEIYKWDEFFIRKENPGHEDRNARWKGLVQRLLQGRDMPVVAHIDVNGKGFTEESEGHAGRMLVCRLGDISGVTYPGSSREIRARVWLKVHNEHLFDRFKGSETGEFLILDRPLFYRDQTNRSLYHVEIGVTDPKRVREVNLPRLNYEARQNAAMRAAGPEAAPAV